MKFSGETWVGNLYQKFEAVCHEVDGLVSQEHIKNLESHVQSVGDNVMKLCSNVKDLLPSSLGVPVEVKAKSVSGNVDCVTNASQIMPEMDVIDSSRSNKTHDQVSDEDLLDGLVTQEHIKSLESHVQSIGDNVMKLCSNVKDLLPSSLGVPVEAKAKSVSGDVDCVANASQILPEMNVTDSSRSNETHDQVSDEDLLEVREEPSSSSSELPFGRSESSVISEDFNEENQSSEVSEQNSDSFTKEKQSASCGSGSGSTLVSSYSCLVTNEVEESSSNFRESISPDKHECESAITLFCDQNHSKEDMVSKNTAGNSAASVNPALLELSHHCEADFFLSKGCTSNWSVIEIGTPWKEKAEDVDSGSLASTDFSILFEGRCCVFVESGSIPGDTGRAPFHKKRVWRKKVVEEEYKQLGIWYGDIDAELDDCLRQKLISPTYNNNRNKHLSSSNREECEWELL